MIDQTSAYMPTELLSKLIVSGVTLYCLPDGDVVFVQAHRMPNAVARFQAPALMQMAFQPTATPKV